MLTASSLRVLVMLSSGETTVREAVKSRHAGLLHVDPCFTVLYISGIPKQL